MITAEIRNSGAVTYTEVVDIDKCRAAPLPIPEVESRCLICWVVGDTWRRCGQIDIDIRFCTFCVCLPGGYLFNSLSVYYLFIYWFIYLFIYFALRRDLFHSFCFMVEAFCARAFVLRKSFCLLKQTFFGGGGKLASGPAFTSSRSCICLLYTSPSPRD